MTTTSEKGPELTIVPLRMATSSRPSWLKSPTATRTPPPGEVIGERNAGTARSSSRSTPGRSRRPEAFFTAISFRVPVCGTLKGHRYGRADPAPGRCRAGGGVAWRLLPAGRFVSCAWSWLLHGVQLQAVNTHEVVFGFRVLIHHRETDPMLSLT